MKETGAYSSCVPILSLKQELSYCRGWPTVLCLHRRCVEYLATGNFYLLA